MRDVASLLIVLIIILSYALVAVFPARFDHAPSSSTKSYTLDPNQPIASSQKGIQMRTLVFITVAPSLTPTTALTPTTGSSSPTPTPILAATPTPFINFSLSTIDWEDVILVLKAVNKYDTLSCKNELEQASIDEYGVPDVTYNQLPSVTSRVGLCLSNRSCQENGYDHYPGTLPQTHLSSTCIESLNSIFQSINTEAIQAYIQHDVFQDVFGSQNANCDRSDYICIPHATYCAQMPSVIFYSTQPGVNAFVSYCP